MPDDDFEIFEELMGDGDEEEPELTPTWRATIRGEKLMLIVNGSRRALKSPRTAHRKPRASTRCHPLATAAEENIALIHRGLDAFSRGDFDAAVEDMQPDIEWHVSFRLPDLPLDKAVYHGPDEVRELWAAFRSAWAKLTVTLEEVVDARDDLVVVRTRFVGRGGSSGVEVDRTVFYVFEIAAGKLKRLRPFDAEADALAAAGVEGAGG